MKISIDSNGCLWLERAGKIQPQFCPFYVRRPEEHTVSMCGDWCPHFGVPDEDAFSISLKLSCGAGRLLFTDDKDFTDERERII